MEQKLKSLLGRGAGREGCAGSSSAQTRRGAAPNAPPGLPLRKVPPFLPGMHNKRK